MELRVSSGCKAREYRDTSVERVCRRLIYLHDGHLGAIPSILSDGIVKGRCGNGKRRPKSFAQPSRYVVEPTPEPWKFLSGSWNKACIENQGQGNETATTLTLFRTAEHCETLFARLRGFPLPLACVSTPGLSNGRRLSLLQSNDISVIFYDREGSSAKDRCRISQNLVYDLSVIVASPGDNAILISRTSHRFHEATHVSGLIMNRASASNNPWLSPSQSESHSGCTTRQAYYHDGFGQRPVDPNHHAPPPTYEDAVFRQPQLSPFDSRKPTNYQNTNAREAGITAVPAPTASSASGDDILYEALEFTQQCQPPHISNGSLRLPVAVPQVIPGLGQPFARCYSDKLQEHGISAGDFVKFIDNLNVVSAGSPPLQIVDLAGGVVGMIPFHHAQLVSLGIQSVAKIGKAAVSKTRGCMFLSKANEEFFNPRGLKAELVTSDALKFKLKMDLCAPLRVTSERIDHLGMLERRAAALQGFAAPLTFDVPPLDQQTNILNKMSAAQQKGVMAKQEKKFIKERSKHAEERSSQSSSDESDGGAGGKRQELEMRMQKQTERCQRKVEKINDAFDEKLARKPKDASKLERERSKEVQKVEKETRKEIEDLEGKLRKAGRGRGKEKEKSHKQSKKSDKETKALNKIQWILVESI